jgi:thiosulfate/3-mercaptopyruvate sulfurtransferase
VADKTTLIESQDLHEAMESSSKCFVFDCRFSLADDGYGVLAFKDKHIPTAQFADLNLQLSAPIIPGKTGRHPLPARETFLRHVQSWGVTPGAQVVAYDDGNGVFAARLWWMFRWLGHESVAVLNGGLTAWLESGFATTAEVYKPVGSGFEIRSPLTESVSADNVLSQPGLLTDARDLPRFKGEVEPIDPVAGHIPGAICLPFTANLNGVYFKSADELRQRFLDAGVGSNSQVTCYCGSGVSAAHNILALLHAGFNEPVLYAGSWSEWITNPERPVASGE